MRKNGFTLIELLAVIVILAIIALIAVPIVINIINDAKEESMKRNINIYLEAATATITKENLKGKYNPDTCIIQGNGNIICSENGNELISSNGAKELTIVIKGAMPSGGTIKLQNGKIANIIDIHLNNKYYGFDSKGNIIDYETPKAPGLYDEDYNLLASWDELVNYGFTGNTRFKTILDNNQNLNSGKILIISDSVTSIGRGTFAGCSGLTSITIPNSATIIKDFAFSDCTGLTSIVIPSNVTSIGSLAFAGCSSLASIKVDLGNTMYEDRNSNAIIKKNNNELILGCKNTSIPDSVTSIGDNAFLGCTGLTSITIPDSVTSIGSLAFENCTNLTSITIPNSVTSIRSLAFENCTNLISVTFENTTGWNITDFIGMESMDIDVTNASTNATNLKDTYLIYDWHRSQS